MQAGSSAITLCTSVQYALLWNAVVPWEWDNGIESDRIIRLLKLWPLSGRNYLMAVVDCEKICTSRPGIL